MSKLDQRAFSDDMDALARHDLYFFVMRAFEELYDREYHDNWHIAAITHWLTDAADGKRRRVLITMPPRSLKSFIGSVCFPAWLLGREPGAKIVCASYAQHLSEEFAIETRKLMQSDWYKRVFPNVHLDPKKMSAKIMYTTRGGQRRATSVEGAITGFGGDYVIIDDPMKASHAYSEVARENTVNWYRGSVTSRLDDPKNGKIIVIAQRLHLEDLPGYLMEQGHWDHLDLPAEEWKNRDVEIAKGRFVERKAGDLLHPQRIGKKELAQLRADMGERDFEAQYNQRPMPPGGALFKGTWLRRYDKRPSSKKVQAIVQSWDTAYDIEVQHDYSACTTWALSGENCYLLGVFRDKLEFSTLQKAIYEQRRKWKADLVIVEKAGSGHSVYQNIRGPCYRKNAWLQELRPQGSKEDRASQQTPRFERGEIWLPKTADWLEDFENELLAFPHYKHDDQVDSAIQFLTALSKGRLLTMVEQARRTRHLDD
uniref:phage terminase large subunit n=1 Tax=uncultured Altererythrobacter sp. TaxID=500840 RepID=UPI00262747E6|nr:phage terminase large subunit [uncultured Altererythrobacter sp.]